MAKKRKQRRIRDRAHEKLVHDLESLAGLEPGGSPERPIVVDTPAVVDLRAVAKPCPLCEGSLRLEAHTADDIDGVRLRIANLSCGRCGVRRKRYFRLAETTLH